MTLGPLDRVDDSLFQPLDLRAFWAAHGEWSLATFGSMSERGPTGPLKHLAKEAMEAADKPEDISEFADCLLLTFDSARRAGFTYDQLVEAAWAKLEVNKARVWPKAASDAPVEHTKIISYVIRYTDGAYNWQEGHPTTLEEATRYTTHEEAEDQADGLVDVAGIEEVTS